MEKVNYLLIVGDKEAENGTVSVRKRGETGDMGSMTLEEFIAFAREEIDTKAIR